MRGTQIRRLVPVIAAAALIAAPVARSDETGSSGGHSSGGPGYGISAVNAAADSTGTISVVRPLAPPPERDLIAQRSASRPSGAQASPVIAAAQDGRDWGDIGLGALAGIALTGVLAAAAFSAARTRKTAAHS